jgi:pimeloyl-ACP methyl ester carboxylesterase
VRIGLYLATLTAVAVLAGTAGGATAVDSCVHSLAGAKVTKLRPHTLREVDLVTAGHGPRAVLFSNQSDNSLCAWLPLARPLVQAGFRVGLYDYSGLGAVADATVAAGELRRQGSNRVGLVGASEGAKVAIAAATSTGAAAVVSLSPERFLDGYGDVLPAARRLRAPILFFYGKGDPLAEVNTPQLYRATRERDKQLVGLPGWGHGTALLAHPSVRARIVAFLRSRL